MRRFWFLGLMVFIAFMGGVSLSGISLQAPLLTHGIASGDVTPTSAIVWGRANGPTTLTVEYSTDENFANAARSQPLNVAEPTDFTGQITIKDLKPATRYYYRVIPGANGPPVSGSFVTAPTSDASPDVHFAWSADLGGQSMCRNPEYFIFKALRDAAPEFFLYLGDTIYADERCPAPPNLPGSDFPARTLAEFRLKHQYNRLDKPYQSVLASTATFATWDDHDVTNDFAGTNEPLMPLGRQAFFEYFPMTRQSDPNRMYRSFPWGKNIEVFILDMRQYRSPNTDPDGPNKTMLGAEQLAWLKDGLRNSKATWKIIGASVALSVPSNCPTACDDWANSGSATGFERELLDLTNFILQNRIKNILWLTADLHYAQVISYDPNSDGTPDFYEFTSGPLSALLFFVAPLDPTLNPTLIYGDANYPNFGQISVKGSTGQITLEFVDQVGETRYKKTLDPR